MTRKHQVKASLTGWVTVPVEDDTGDPSSPRNIELADVPVLGIETRPVDGLTLHYGRSDVISVLHQQTTAARAQGMNLYEVKVMMDAGTTSPKAFLQREDLDTAKIVSLPRISMEAAAYLHELIRDQIDAIGDDVSDTLIDPGRLHVLVSKYPHLVDALASAKELRHVVVFVWNADVPGATNSRLATIYDPEKVIEVRTLNADFVRAVLPPHLATDPARRLSAMANGATVGFFRRPKSPGM